MKIYNNDNTTQYPTSLEMLNISVQWDKLALIGIVVYSGFCVQGCIYNI